MKNKRIEMVTCSKSTAIEPELYCNYTPLGLNKQDNSNGTCAADVEQIIIWLANNTVNKITEIMTCSKSVANASGLRKQSGTDGVC